jgi:hypothetical protein
VLELFSRDILPSVEGKINLAAVSDAAWQGACLAIAESIRRGTLEAIELPKVMPWIMHVRRVFFYSLRGEEIYQVLMLIGH